MLLGDDASLQPLTQSPRQVLPPPSGLRWLRKAAAASAGALGARQGARRGRQSGQWGGWKRPFDFPILWTERDTFAFNGRYNQQRYVNIWPRLVQKPHPPVWIPGGSIETWQWYAKMDYVYAYLSYFGYKNGRADSLQARQEARATKSSCS